jgi:hypothetical protein
MRAYSSMASGNAPPPPPRALVGVHRVAVGHDRRHQSLAQHVGTRIRRQRHVEETPISDDARTRVRSVPTFRAIDAAIDKKTNFASHSVLRVGARKHFVRLAIAAVRFDQHSQSLSSKLQPPNFDCNNTRSFVVHHSSSVPRRHRAAIVPGKEHKTHKTPLRIDQLFSKKWLLARTNEQDLCPSETQKATPQRVAELIQHAPKELHVRRRSIDAAAFDNTTHDKSSSTDTLALIKITCTQCVDAATKCRSYRRRTRANNTERTETDTDNEQSKNNDHRATERERAVAGDDDTRASASAVSRARAARGTIASRPRRIARVCSHRAYIAQWTSTIDRDTALPDDAIR